MDRIAAFTPSDFVAVLNQTLEYAYPSVVIVGELANLRISKGRWVYFDLKDDAASVKFFGTVYGLPGPLEDGMMVRVVGRPRLSELYGFSVSFQTVTAVGEGALKRAADLLQRKLATEGLFDDARKRSLPYPPTRIGLVASEQSAAYKDFVKILNARWGGLEILLADVQVQGDAAPSQIVAAIEHFNQHEAVELIVVTRGGGSPDDLAAFSTEQVTRAVAASRTPTMVAIGHEIDISLAELAADVRASTPSNAAELLTPDRAATVSELRATSQQLDRWFVQYVRSIQEQLGHAERELAQAVLHGRDIARTALATSEALLDALSPSAVLRRGYAVVRTDHNGKIAQSAAALKPGEVIDVMLADGSIKAEVQ